jgi:DUF3040 family protein
LPNVPSVGELCRVRASARRLPRSAPTTGNAFPPRRPGESAGGLTPAALQGLRAGDPRFAEVIRAADPRVRCKRRVIAAAPGFVIGVGLLLAWVVINVIPVAVAGFVVMLACSLWAVTSDRRMTGITTGRVPGPGQGCGQGAARRQEPAGWQAGGIRAAGAAGRSLAASPGWRPLTPGCRCVPLAAAPGPAALA